MRKISFDVDDADLDIIDQIVVRAKAKINNMSCSDLRMDLVATHCNGRPLDLEKLLRADEFTFSHDIYGITDHLNRKTGKLMNCFRPRCSC